MLGHGYMTTFQNKLSFAVMTILISLGIQIVSCSSVSTGPHLYLYLGWLELHRYGDHWSVEHIYLRGLIAVFLISGLLAWLLAKVVRR
jgi:hypothetical protein